MLYLLLFYLLVSYFSAIRISYEIEDRETEPFYVVWTASVILGLSWPILLAFYCLVQIYEAFAPLSEEEEDE